MCFRCKITDFPPFYPFTKYVNIFTFSVILPIYAKTRTTTIKRLTGLSVTSYINRHTAPILKKYLDDERLSLTQISEMMNFSSLSYFSRYCTKHMGQSPSEYRLSIQPRRRFK